MNQAKAKKLRREVAAQYAEHEADMRARIIQAINDMPLSMRVRFAWRVVDKSPLISEVPDIIKHYFALMVNKIAPKQLKQPVENNVVQLRGNKNG